MNTKWDWLDSTGGTSTWTAYDDDLQLKISDAIKNNKPKLKFETTGSLIKYEIDFQKMVQINLKSKYERSIRMRVQDINEEEEDKNENNVWFYWEWLNDNNRWVVYPPELNLELERHHREYLKDRARDSFKIEITSGETATTATKKSAYIVDFVKMAQINTKSSFSRNVRRSVATGKFSIH